MDDTFNKEVWFELRKSELSFNLERFETERKLRRNREFLLFITCLMGLIYFLPISSIEQDATLEIPSISLKLSLIYALYVYPTIIALLYILVISSSLEQSQLMSLITQGRKELIYFEVNNRIPDGKLYSNFNIGHRYLLLPSLLHSTFYTNSTMSKIFGKIVYSFISLIYFFVPFYTNYLLLSKTHNLIGSWFLFSWNVICLLIMLISYLHAFFSIKYYQNQSA